MWSWIPRSSRVMLRALRVGFMGETEARTVELLDGWPWYHLQLIGGNQAPRPCTDLLGRQLRRPLTPDLLCRGSAPWGGGTVTIHSRAKSRQLVLARIE